MRFLAVLVLAVVLAGYLDRPATWGPSHEAASAPLDPFFPRALKAALSWRSTAVPADIVGDGRWTPPPPDTPHVKVPGSRTGGGADPAAPARGAADPVSSDGPFEARDGASFDAIASSEDPVYAFLDPATRDLLLVEVGPGSTTAFEVPAAAPHANAGRDPPRGLLDPAIDLLDATAPAPPAKPASRADAPAPTPTPAPAACDGWWLCLRASLAAWWG